MDLLREIIVEEASAETRIAKALIAQYKFKTNVKIIEMIFYLNNSFMELNTNCFEKMNSLLAKITQLQENIGDDEVSSRRLNQLIDQLGEAYSHLYAELAELKTELAIRQAQRDQAKAERSPEKWYSGKGHKSHFTVKKRAAKAL